MRLSDQIILKINNDCKTSIPLGTKIKYLNPSLNQQARGMMMWVFENPYSHYGSSIGVKELLKKDNLKISAVYNGLNSFVAVGIKEIL